MICGISGLCLSAGFELALMCDLRVAETTALFGFAANRKYGIPLMDGGTARLPAIIGMSRALDIILTGREVTAKEAFENGLANRLVAPGSGESQQHSIPYSIILKSDDPFHNYFCFSIGPSDQLSRLSSQISAGHSES